MAEHLGFYFGDISRLMRKRFDLAARDSGVTGPQWRVLLTLYRQPGIQQGQLAEFLDVEPITTCRMVDRLESADLVERRRDPRDRRAWQLFLTEAALPLIDHLSAVGDVMAEQATAGLSDEDRTTLVNLLTRVRHNLLEDNMPQWEEKQHG